MALDPATLSRVCQLDLMGKGGLEGQKGRKKLKSIC